MTITARMYLPMRLLRKQADNQVMNFLHKEAAERIKTFILPHKFTSELFKRYPNIAKKRTAKYMRWKANLVSKKIIPRVRPNVLSGELEKEATVRARTTSTAQRGRVYIKTGTGRYVTGQKRGQYYARALKQWQRDEIEYLSDDDIKELTDWIGYWYTDIAIGADYDHARLKRPVHNFKFETQVPVVP